MKKLIKRILPSAKGQGFVEMTLIAPILIFLFIGVFELGWVLRGYLILANVNRETVRFSVRPAYLNFYTRQRGGVGYDKALGQMFATLGERLPFDEAIPQNNALLTLSHFVINTNLPCKDINACDCSTFNYAEDKPGAQEYYKSLPQVFTYDDIVLHPALSDYNFFTYTTYTKASSPGKPTRITDPADYAYHRVLENIKFNCDLMKKSKTVLPSNNNLIVSEIYYNQPQLTHFPFLSVGENTIANRVGIPVTDPFPMYINTAMRMIASSRGNDNKAAIGPYCAALPIAGTAALNQAVPQFDAHGNPSPIYIDNIFNGWLAWNPSHPESSADYLRYELKYTQMAVNDYKGDDPNDMLDAGSELDPVAPLSGSPSAADLKEFQEILATYANREVIIPILSGGSSSGNMDGAAVVILKTDEIDLANNKIGAYLMKRANDECLDPLYRPE